MTVRNSAAVFLICTLAVVAFGCSGMQKTNADTRDADLAALMDADKTWAQTAANKEMEKIHAYFLSDAVVLAPHAPIAEGADAARALFDQMYGLPGFSLTWQATSSEVASSGDLGYTVGTYELSFDGPDGAPIKDNGKYMTVWKKQADGTWKVAVDMFNTNLPQ